VAVGITTTLGVGATTTTIGAIMDGAFMAMEVVAVVGLDAIAAELVRIQRIKMKMSTWRPCLARSSVM
jgi:hypothetical protein